MAGAKERDVGPPPFARGSAREVSTVCRRKLPPNRRRTEFATHRPRESTMIERAHTHPRYAIDAFRLRRSLVTAASANPRQGFTDYHETTLIRHIERIDAE